MKKKECPSCAMEINAEEEVCPICGYEFPTTNPWLKYVVIIIAIIFLLYMIGLL